MQKIIQRQLLRRLVLSAAVLLCFPFIVYCQDMGFRKADSLTYHYYVQYKWDSLISTGKEALENNIDYFYLRTRLGMAYYNKGKYRKAAHELEKAVAFNSADTFALKYLYNSYSFGGQKADAQSLTSRFSRAMDEKMGIKRSEIISGIYAEGGVSLSNAEKKAKNIDFDGQENLYGETLLHGDLSYLSFGLKHRIGNYVSIFHAYTNLTIQMKQFIRVNNINIPNTNNLVQNQYYLQGAINLKRKVIVTPAFHYLRLKYTLLGSVYDTALSRYLFHQVTSRLDNYIAFLGLTKNFPNMSGTLSGSWSNLNYKKQVQANLNITVFPFANLNIYTSTTITGLAEKGAYEPRGRGGVFARIGLGKPRLIFTQMIGGKLYPWLYGELSFTQGDISDYNEKNAFLVFNVPDEIKFRLGASLLFEITHTLEFNLNFQYLEKKNDYIRFLDSENYTQGSFIYQNKTITGGLKWRL